MIVVGENSERFPWGRWRVGEEDTSREVVHCVFGEEQRWVRDSMSFFVKLGAFVQMALEVYHEKMCFLDISRVKYGEEEGGWWFGEVRDGYGVGLWKSITKE